MNIIDFTNAAFGTLHVMVDEDHGLWFFSSEVASFLHHTNATVALKHHVNPEDMKTFTYKECPPQFRSLIWVQNFRDKILVNEAGFYSLALSSRLPSAREFQHWVTHDVLPSIRANGGYILGQEDLDPKELESLKADVKNLSEKVAYLRKRRHELLQEAEKLKQEKRDLKYKVQTLSKEAAEQMDYYLRLIHECAEMEEEVRRARNVLHIREFKNSDFVPEESESEREKKNIYTIDAQGYRVFKTKFDF